MPEPEQVVLVNGAEGIDRETSPHLLDPSDSPQSLDTDYSGKQAGLLGPRKGRSKVLIGTCRIMGIAAFAFPTGHWRVICSNDGTWSASAVTWP